MGYVIYQDSKGEKFKIPENVPFRKGADWVEVETQQTVEEKQLEDSISKIAQVVGISIDETVTRLGKALGIQKCPTCQLRSQILRRMGELGWIETLRRLKATFKK
jgi:hypothetical protein